MGVLFPEASLVCGGREPPLWDRGPLPGHRGIFWFWLHFLEGQHACVGAGIPQPAILRFHSNERLCLSRITYGLMHPAPSTKGSGRWVTCVGPGPRRHGCVKLHPFASVGSGCPFTSLTLRLLLCQREAEATLESRQ